MGWPFQIKIIWSLMLNNALTNINSCLRLLAIMSIIQFFLILVLSQGLNEPFNITYLLMLGSCVNINSCLMTLSVFKVKTHFATFFSSKKIACTSKLGRKTSASILGGALLSLTQILSWEMTYKIAALFYILFAIICLITLKNTPKKHIDTLSREVQNIKFSTWIYGLKNNPYLVAYIIFLSINMGHHLLVGWTSIFLRDIGLGYEFLVRQKFINLAAYGTGLSYGYFFCQKDNFTKHLLFLLCIYTGALLSLSVAQSLNSLEIIIILFAKSMCAAALLFLKYSWITSLCANKKDVFLSYGLLMTISNILTFAGSIAGGWIMAYLSWKTLFFSAAILNIPGIIAIARVDKEYIKNQLSYL